jgi:hypothetical protein
MIVCAILLLLFVASLRVAYHFGWHAGFTRCEKTWDEIEASRRRRAADQQTGANSGT